VDYILPSSIASEVTSSSRPIDGETAEDIGEYRSNKNRNKLLREKSSLGVFPRNGKVVVNFTPKKAGFLRNLEKNFMEIRRCLNKLEIKFCGIRRWVFGF